MAPTEQPCIRCTLCGRISFNVNDCVQRFCAACGLFHASEATYELFDRAELVASGYREEWPTRPDYTPRRPLPYTLGGCWFCGRDRCDAFSSRWDAFVHERCIRNVLVKYGDGSDGGDPGVSAEAEQMRELLIPPSDCIECGAQYLLALNASAWVHIAVQGRDSVVYVGALCAECKSQRGGAWAV